ncbi:MAG: hypothetical protein WEF50_19015 [Myxococcota bacterium]
MLDKSGAIELITTIVELTSKLACLRKKKERQRFQAAIERVDEILRDLVDACDDPSSSRALRLQAEARAMYTRLSELVELNGRYGDLPGFLGPSDPRKQPLQGI